MTHGPATGLPQQPMDQCRHSTDVEFEDQAILALASEGRKEDSGKARFDLMPPEMLFGVSDVLAFGATKYGERNWEQGMSWGRIFAALMRHLWAWWRGDQHDAETGLSHLSHAGCCIGFLMAYEQRQIGVDNRPRSQTTLPRESLAFEAHMALQDVARTKP